MMISYRKHTLYGAFLIHRISGVALALFLPFHFWVLSLALTNPATLDGFLSWAELPFVKLAEFGFVFLLAAHLFGGVRLMAMEWLPWTPSQKTMAAAAFAVSVLIAGLFLLRAI